MGIDSIYFDRDDRDEELEPDIYDELEFIEFDMPTRFTDGQGGTTTDPEVGHVPIPRS